MFGTEQLECIEQPEWQLRVIQERAELEHMLQRLNSFKAVWDAPGMSTRQQELLEKQRNIMKEYYDVLGERICSFDAE